MSLPTGTTLGTYEILAPLGAGGMGVVYRARDLKLGRTVAIKVLSGDFSSDSQRTRRFEQEARAASALNHSNVCVVYALGETPDGQPFIAMEYIEGHTLRRVLQTRPPALRGILDIAIQVASGVGAAHAIGIVHRDLKPENVLVREDGVAKVLDFGLAKLAAGGLPSDVPEATHTLLQTDAGLVMGTFTYMAPEQARGVDVDARADIWALGVMLYEMVSGHAPFSGETRSDVLAAILEREPPPLDRVDPRIPHELQRIVGKALRKDRAQRYQTITDLRLDLEALRGELQSSSEASASAVLPTPAVPVLPTPPPMRRESSAEFLLTGLGRHKIATAASVLVLVGMVVLAAWWIRQGRSATSSTAEATSPAHRNLTRLTFGEGLQTDPTFSPDGRFIAYASDRAGNFDIWVQPVAGGDPVQVTKSPASDTQPAWSPDGSTIVFRSERDGGGLYRVPALGGQEQQLAPFGVHPTWSKDGAAVYFLVGPSLESGEGPALFYTVALDGNPPRELGSKFLAGGSWRWIAVHPDGRISALGTHATRGSGFFTFSDNGTVMVASKFPAKSIPIQASAFQRTRFQWNAAGTRLYLESTENSLENLWRVQVDPLTLEWRSVERLTTDAASDVAAALSHDESRLAFTQRNVSTRLWAFPFDAGAGQPATLMVGSHGAGKPVTDPSGVAQAFSLSPDGNWLAHTLVRPGTNASELSLINIDSGKTEFLTRGGFSSAWSADGRRLAFAKFQTGKEAMFLRTLGAPDEQQISPWNKDTALLPTCWTPDGRALIVSASGSATDDTPMWLWSVASGTEKPARVLLQQRGINFWQGQMSPNGRWLAFVPERPADPGRGRIAIAPAEGAPADRWTYVAPESPWADKPRWARDGRTLYFIAKGTGGYFNLMAQRFDPDRGTAVGAPATLTRFDAPSLFISPFVNRTEIGIAAHRAVLTMLSISGSVWMLDGVDR